MLIASSTAVIGAIAAIVGIYQYVAEADERSAERRAKSVIAMANCADVLRNSRLPIGETVILSDWPIVPDDYVAAVCREISEDFLMIASPVFSSHLAEHEAWIEKTNEELRESSVIYSEPIVPKILFDVE